MSDVFISYARSTERQAHQVAEALRALGHGVWMDDQIPAHRSFTEVIEERLKLAKAVVVIWSAEARESHWVRAEAKVALDARTLVQMRIDSSPPPLPFNQIQCVDLDGWEGDLNARGWRKIVASVADLVGGPAPLSSEAAPAPPALPDKPSIAVLPFANLSGDPEQDYFADGMVEEIARALSRFKSIFVIGGASGLSFKKKAVTPRDAARILGVRYVLEGSVRKAGGRVRIAAKLIDCTDGAQIWADRFDDTLEDVFALQDKVALAVGGVIEPALHEAAIRRATARPVENLGSYDLCLRALALCRTLAKDDVLAALVLLDRAVALEPESGSALAMAAVCHGSVVANGWSDDVIGHFLQGKSCIERGTKVAGSDPDVLINLSIASTTLGDLEAARTFADRAMEINPGSSTVWLARGWVKVESAEPDLAFEHFETTLRLDPFSPYRANVLCGMGIARFAQKRFNDAVPFLKEAFQLQPELSLAYIFLAACFSYLGEIAAAREAVAEFRKLTGLEMRDSAARWPEPGDRRLLLEGIALAEEA